MATTATLIYTQSDRAPFCGVNSFYRSLLPAANEYGEWNFDISQTNKFATCLSTTTTTRLLPLKRVCLCGWWASSSMGQWKGFYNGFGGDRIWFAWKSVWSEIITMICLVMKLGKMWYLAPNTQILTFAIQVDWIEQWMKTQICLLTDSVGRLTLKSQSLSSLARGNSFEIYFAKLTQNHMHAHDHAVKND